MVPRTVAFRWIPVVAWLWGCPSPGSNGPDVEGPCPVPVTAACSVDYVASKGWPARNASDGVHLYRRPLKLVAGDVLTPGLFPDEADPVRIDQDSWLFVADWNPGAMWTHPTDWVVIGIDTGRYDVYARDVYPAVNGVGVLSSDEERADADHQLPDYDYTTPHTAAPASASARYRSNNQDGFPLELPPPADVDNHLPDDEDIDFSKYTRRDTETDEAFRNRVRGLLEDLQTDTEVTSAFDSCGCDGLVTKRLALILNGGNLSRSSTEAAAAYYRSQNFQVRSLSPTGTGINKTTLANIRTAFEWLAAEVSSCCDEVVVLVHGHGSRTGAIDMNVRQTLENADGTTRTIGDPEGGRIRTSTLKTYLDAVRSCDTTVLLETCFSGSQLERGLNTITEQTASGCMCRTVIAASSARQPSYGGIIGSFVDALKTGKSTQDAFLAMRALASAPDLIDDRSKQKWWQTPTVQSTPGVLCEDPDDDGLLSGEEIANGSNPNEADCDGDGLDDLEEQIWGTDPDNADTDGDGLPDGTEVDEGTDPADADSDDDGLNDQQERFAGSDPHDPDSDDDGLHDGEEALEEPRSNPTDPDTDDDGIDDYTEVTELGTHPNDPDTDDDGVPDGEDAAPTDPSRQ